MTFAIAVDCVRVSARAHVGGGGGVRARAYVSVSVCVYLGACRCDDLYVFLSAPDYKVHIHSTNV